MENVLIAFLFTAIAGLSTGIGSAIALISKKQNAKFLSLSLGFSAGVMIYVSLVELYIDAQKSLSLVYGQKSGVFIAIAAFFGGIAVIALIDKLIPTEANPHEIKDMSEGEPRGKTGSLMRTGIFTALAIAIHNFPEGLATFVSALSGPRLAIPIVVAIALHNIPEGIAVSVPIYYATGSKRKAFLYSFMSGLSEPVGAVIGYLILLPFMSDAVQGILFSAVAGIMVFISLDELLPAARAYDEHHLSIYGVVAGMAIMSVSLWLFL